MAGKKKDHNELHKGIINELTGAEKARSELHGTLQIETSLPVKVMAKPHRTVSQSEAGFEKIMQAVCVVLRWTPLPGKEQRISLRVIPAS